MKLIKLFFVVLLLFATTSSIWAQTVTAATNGTNITIDNSSVATTPGWTTLTGPVVIEASVGQFTTGDYTLTLPAGWQFDVTQPITVTATGGDVTFAVSGSPYTPTTTVLTLHVSVSSTVSVGTLTFSNIKVQPTGTTPSTGDMSSTLKAATNFGTLSSVAGAFTKLQLLVPGETAAPGTTNGKTGTPSAQIAGTSFSVTVNAVDQFWNLVTSTDNVGITTTDPNDTHPASAALAGGTQTFNVTFKTAGSETITATDVEIATTITPNTSPSITINPGTFTKLQLLVPGETAAPGTPSGKTGSPSAQTAGTPFNVTVKAVDANWNLAGGTDIVGITSSDLSATLPLNSPLVVGTKTFSVTLYATGTITASDITNIAKSANTSPSITVSGVAPANYAVGVSILPTFTWTAATANYTLDISTSNSFPVGLTTKTITGITTNSYTLTYAAGPLENGKKYYWRVSHAAPGDVLATQEFVTVNAAKPSLNPINPGATSAFIAWYPVPYSSGLTYDIFVSTSTNYVTWSSFAIPGNPSGADLTHTYYTLPVTQGTSYKVQVRAKKGNLIISYSDVSDIFGPASLPAPTASYPTDNAADGDVYANPPVLFWYIEGNEPTLNYEIEVFNALDTHYSLALSADQDSLSATGFSSAKTYAKVPFKLVAGYTYTWHVRSVSGTVKSNWSATATFKMYSNVATSNDIIVPTPSWPVGNATLYQNPPTMYWYLGSDKTGFYYQVRYGTSTDGTNATGTVVAEAGSTQNLFKALTATLLPNTTYYWQVRSSWNNTDWSSWSTVGLAGPSQASFTIASTASGAATTPIPSWPIGGAIVDGTMADITLNWTAPSTTDLDFQVIIATDNHVTDGMLDHGSAVTSAWDITATSVKAQDVFGTLTSGATYYWQVRSGIRPTHAIYSPWSMVASFSTAAGASSVVPLVVSPNYLQPLNNTTAVLTWNIPVQSDSHLKYDLQYSKNADFNNALTKTNLNDPSALVTGLETNSTYYWRVLSKTASGSVSSYSTTGSFTTSGATAVEEQETIPTAYELSQNYPNPFNPTTRINFAIPQNSFVTIKVYDMLGREVKTLINQQMVSGNHSIDWNADNNLGIKVATGMYIYRITAGNFVSTKKMVLIK